MSILGIIKVFVPWLLIAQWLVRFKSNRKRGAALVTLYIAVFAGFSSNFTPLYREFGQIFSLLLGLFALAKIYTRRSIPAFALPLLGALFFIVVSLMVNGASSLALDATLNFVAVSLVSLMVVSELLGDSRRNAFFEHFVLVAVIVSVASIIEGVLTGARAEATFSNTNYLAYFLGVASCFVLGRFAGKRGWTLFALIVLGIYCTKSRAGLAFPLLAASAYVVSLGARRLLRAAPIVVLAGLMLSVVTAAFPGLQRENADSSDAERLVAIEAGFEMVRGSPVFGVGWGRYMEEFWGAASRAPVLFAETIGANIGRHRDMVSHNDIVRVFAELGVLAGLCFLMLLAWSARAVVRLPAELRSSLAAALGGSLFFSVTHNNLNSALFWIVLLLPIALRARDRDTLRSDS